MKEPRYRLVLTDMSADEIAGLLIACDHKHSSIASRVISKKFSARLLAAAQPLLDANDAWRRRTFKFLKAARPPAATTRAPRRRGRRSSG